MFKENAYERSVIIYSKVFYFYPLKEHLMSSGGEVLLVQIVVKRWTISEGGKNQQPCQKTARYWMETDPIGIHGVFWNKQPQNLTWFANKPWQIDSGRLCISATATKRQTVCRLMLLQLNVQICTAAFWPRREEETSDTPHWNACYLLLVFIGCRSNDKVALTV